MVKLTEEQWGWLKGGPEGISLWNAWRLESRGRRIKPLDLSAADLRRADLRLTNLTGVNLSGANLSQANLTGANLSGAELRRANLSQADLSDIDLFGTNLSQADLAEANLSHADLDEVDLSYANLSGANLAGANLVRANLFGANLTAANLSWADLTEANLSHADLDEVDLSYANLSGANLSGANLVRANLSGAELRRANLTAANLSWAELRRANLTGTNLIRADLTLARFIRSDLTAAVVENAIVRDVQVHELQGLPQPPTVLRLDYELDGATLTGHAAATFFVLPAVVEAYLTRLLSDIELGCLHFHQGEVHGSRVAADVYLVGHRCEGDCSVLRFQGPTYEAVYLALPDLLAAFRTSAAIDWRATLEALPAAERPDAFAALVKVETRLKAGRWRMAERLAQAFEGFAGTRVLKLTDGRKKGIHITVVTDESIVEKLDRAVMLPMTIQNVGKLFLGPTNNNEVDGHMGDTTNANIGGDAIGSPIGTGASVTARDIMSRVTQTADATVNKELAAAVKAAIEALATAKLDEEDAKEAAAKVEEIHREAEKTEPDAKRPGKVRRWLDTLAAICQPAADALKAAAKVVSALGG